MVAPTDDQPTLRSAVPPDGKLPYQPPKVTVYGTLQELTQALGEPGNDNSPGSPSGSTL